MTTTYTYGHDNALKLQAKERKELVRTMQETYGITLAIQPLMTLPGYPYKNKTEIVIKGEEKLNGQLEELVDVLEEKLGL